MDTFCFLNIPGSFWTPILTLELLQPRTSFPQILYPVTSLQCFLPPVCVSQDVAPHPTHLIHHHARICFTVCREVTSLSEIVCSFIIHLPTVAEGPVCLLFHLILSPYNSARHVVSTQYLLHKCIYIYIFIFKWKVITNVGVCVWVLYKSISWWWLWLLVIFTHFL